MPIYAYKCDSCGFAKDVLQKISDQPLVQCPACQAQAFKKQLTAAGFQLKGSGWYATDFKGGNKPAAPAGEESKSGADTSTAPATTPSDSGGKAKSDPAPAPAATPAPEKKTAATPSTGSGS